MSCITEILKIKGDNEILRESNDEKKMGTIIEGGGNYKGYEYLVTFAHTHRCGYVAIPANHAFYKHESYDDLPIECHGGVTFYDQEHHLKKQFVKTSCDDKWIGFDCIHAWDSADIESMKKYYGADNELAKTFANFNSFALG